MADPLSMLASSVAVAGLATKVAKSLDDLAGRWQNAELSLQSLKTTIASFNASLNSLSRWIEIEYQTSGACTDLAFVQNLAVSMEGCARFLLALQIELDLIGHNSGTLPWTKKAAVLWNENRIKDLRDHLMCQNQGLLLLLACRNLSHHQGEMMQQETRQKMVDVRKDTARLRLDGPTANVPVSGSKAGNQVSAKTIEIHQKMAPHLAFLTETSDLMSPSTSSTQVGHVTKLVDAENLREDYEKLLSRDLDFIVPDCPKLRILILGQAGIGKSTLCSIILGISPNKAGVSHRGPGTPAGKVWEEVTGPQNKHLILHDSGGFRANSGKEMSQIKAFIKFRKEQKLLKDQLHCIWYCVASTGARNVQEVDEEFFEEIDTGEIPVFVVFTKYDLLIKDHEDDSDDESLSSHLTPKQRFAKAEEPAFKDFEMNLESQIMDLGKKKLRIKTCRVAIPRLSKNKSIDPQGKASIGKEYKLVKYRIGDLAGTSDLTEAVGEVLSKEEGGGLRDLWIAGQRNRADLKLKASWQRCVKQWWKVQNVSMIPLVPIICMWTLGKAYTVILRRLTQIWGLKTSPEGLLASKDNLHFGFLEATYDESREGLILNSSLLAISNVGPLVGSTTAKITLKMIVGLTLIFERLFLKQQKQGEDAVPLTAEMIREEARKFQHSLERSRMSNAIEKKITLANCYKEVSARSAAWEAIDVGKSRDAEKYSTGFAM